MTDGRRLSTPAATEEDLARLVERVRSCSACADYLPIGPRPVLRISSTATLLIASQAPGIRAHESGVPFSDASGAQLRRWMEISDDRFYDEARVAIVPMGLCYPGRANTGGDAPPRPECSPLWRDRLLAQLPRLRLALLVGTYAQEHVFGRGKMIDRVRELDRYLPEYFCLPHPSWRSRAWMTKNPWFEEIVLPKLRRHVSEALA